MQCSYDPEKGSKPAPDNNNKHHFEIDASSIQLQAHSSTRGVTAVAG